MSNLNNRELQTVRLKAVSYIPTVGNLGPTLLKGMNKNLIELTMNKVEEGVYLSGETQGAKFEAFIPNTQIEIIQFVQE